MMTKRNNQSSTQMMKSQNVELEAENKKQSWKPFLHLIRSVKLPWLLILLCIIINFTQGYLTLLFPEYTEDIYAGNFTPALAVTAVLVVLGQSILTALLQFVAGYTSNLNHMRFQSYIWKKLSRLPVSYFEDHEPRDLISRTTQDTMSLSEFFAYSISYFFSSIYTFLGSLVLIFNYDWRLALSQAIIIPVCYLVGVIAGRVYFKLNNRIQGKLSDMTRYFSAVLPYLTLVKLFGQENREEANGNYWIEKYAEVNFQSSLAGSAISVANTLSQVLRELLLILMGVWLIQEGSLEVSAWIAFYMYANTLYNGMQMIMAQWQTLKRNQGACARISAVTSVPEEANPGTLDATAENKDLVFHNVSFAYQQNNVLNEVSFTAKKGQVTAIVGPSGAGKSTILSLVERFYEPKEGEILLGDHKASEYERKSWRQDIAYIPQDTHLFSGTIRDNIAYGMQGKVSEAKILEAAKKADAYDFIMGFEKGFDTPVGENGARLSGGQRQRIAIARALLRDARVLLLDEATSNLDAESEYQVEQTLKELSEGRTILLVAHHMDTVKQADHIIVMENSRVNGEGTHEELMNNNELYRRLVRLQAGGKLAGEKEERT